MGPQLTLLGMNKNAANRNRQTLHHHIYIYHHHHDQYHHYHDYHSHIHRSLFVIILPKQSEDQALITLADHKGVVE